MGNLLDLAQRMRTLNATLPEAASTIAAKAALAVTYYLTDVTPVDVSTALSNWQLQLDTPANRSVLAYYPGKGGSTEAESEQYADYAALQSVKNKKPGQPIYVTNNVDYIEELNDGTSLQEPGGFVERAVIIGELYVAGSDIDIEKLQTGFVDKNYEVKGSGRG